MSKTYIIQWKSKVNGRAGRGTKLFDRDEAERLANELNHEYPDILHEAISAPSQPVAPAADAEVPDRQEEPAFPPAGSRSA